MRSGHLRGCHDINFLFEVRCRQVLDLGGWHQRCVVFELRCWHDIHCFRFHDLRELRDLNLFGCWRSNLLDMPLWHLRVGHGTRCLHRLPQRHLPDQLGSRYLHELRHWNVQRGYGPYNGLRELCDRHVHVEYRRDRLH